MSSEILAALLALIQGVAEFLPISSSGHLALAQNIYGLAEPEVAFDIILHLATLLAVVIFYRQQIYGLLLESKYLLKLIPGGVPAFRLFYKSRPNFRFLTLIVVASIPTGIIGLLFQKTFTSLSTSTLAIGCALMFTGVVLKISGRKSGDNGRDIEEMNIANASKFSKLRFYSTNSKYQSLLFNKDNSFVSFSYFCFMKKNTTKIEKTHKTEITNSIFVSSII